MQSVLYNIEAPNLEESGDKFLAVDSDGKLTGLFTINSKNIYLLYTELPKGKVIEGYDLIKTPNNAKGTFTEEDITVTYVYREKDPEIPVNPGDPGAGED